jgi:hypothetical protein
MAACFQCSPVVEYHAAADVPDRVWLARPTTTAVPGLVHTADGNSAATPGGASRKLGLLQWDPSLLVQTTAGPDCTPDPREPPTAIQVPPRAAAALDPGGQEAGAATGPGGPAVVDHWSPSGDVNQMVEVWAGPMA